ncbi:MAG: prevent-host-death protein [Gemmatimonadetes bacterium]|nr:prevent-host-death protein [Gemmatimonadota bacterium]
MYTVHVDEARTRLSELMRDAVSGEEVVISQEDGSAVRLVPVAKKNRPTFGSARGMFEMADDFDAPLDDFLPYMK